MMHNQKKISPHVGIVIVEIDQKIINNNKIK